MDTIEPKVSPTGSETAVQLHVDAKATRDEAAGQPMSTRDRTPERLGATEGSLEDIRKELGTLESACKTFEAKTSVTLSWHRYLIVACITTIVSLGGYRVLLDPHPIDKSAAKTLQSLETLNLSELVDATTQTSTVLVDYLIANVEKQIVDLLRKVTFPQRSGEVHQDIVEVVDLLKGMGSLASGSSKYTPLRHIADAMLQIAESDHGEYHNVAQKMHELSRNSQLAPGPRVIAAALRGKALTLMNQNRYSRQAQESYEQATKLSAASGIHIGIAYNGLAVQGIYRAEQLASRGEHVEGSRILSRAIDYLRDQNLVDGTPLSSYKQTNNTNYALCTFLLWVVQRPDVDPEIILQNKPESYFAEMESRLVTAESIANPFGTATAISTTAEYFSLKGEYYEKIVTDRDLAKESFELSKQKMLEAIDAGLCRKYGPADNAIKTLVDEFRRVEAMLKWGNNRDEIIRAIKDYFR